jgi:hypothetical protein
LETGKRLENLDFAYLLTSFVAECRVVASVESFLWVAFLHRFIGARLTSCGKILRTNRSFRRTFYMTSTLLASSRT